MQSAEEFAIIVSDTAREWMRSQESGDESRAKAAALIRARDKEIVEACAEAAKTVMIAHGWYPGKAGIVDGSIQAILRDLG
jgi:hypothetical protein